MCAIRPEKGVNSTESSIFWKNLKPGFMSAKITAVALCLTLIISGMYAQEKEYKVKVFDLQDVVTTLDRASSSSSSSCETSDFPVYQGSTKMDVNFADLKSIIVRHDIPAEDPNNYVTVELEFLNGSSDLYEMVKHIRITGRGKSGSFSKKIMEINLLEIVHKMY